MIRKLEKLLVIQSVVLLAFFQVVPIFSQALALSFDPAFGVILTSNSPGVISDVTLTTTQPVGDEFLDKVTFRVPAGWDISSGSTIADGATVATGTVDFVYLGTPQSIPFTFTNVANSGGHLARWLFNTPPPFCCLQVDVDGTKDTGYSFTIDPSLTVDTPLNFTINFLGSVGGVPLFTNPLIGGDYTWNADYLSPTGVIATRAQTLSIPGTLTPTGTDVTASFNNGSSVTFSSVTSEGVTTIATSETTPPEGTGQFQLSGGLYYDFTTTATIACPCTVTLPYDPVATPNPKIYHLESGIWVDSTTFVDTVNHTVTGTVSSFSFFAPGQPDFGLTFLDPVEALLKVSNPMSLQNNRTLPVNFTLADSSSNFVSRTDVTVQVVDNSSNTLVTTIPVSLKNNHYMANLDLKSLGLTVGSTYKMRIVVGNTVNAPTPLFVPK